MSANSENNKRIAKNTLFLYMRMLLIMGVTLYTSRVVLSVLGVEDFGIYNVVGGIVAMCSILNGAMAVSTQRYLTYELGRADSVRFSQTFSVCVTIYLLFSVLFFILAETVGVWFLNTKLVIPSARMIAANWAYQFSVLTAIASLLYVPYTAALIAYEKMTFYAYVGIFEAISRLSVVLIISYYPCDRLVAYSLLLALITMLVALFYRYYCVIHIKECRYFFYWDKNLFTQLFAYSGWNLFGSVSSVVKGQGLNMLLNIFFNPSVNASRGIAYQVNAAITQFSSNFYTAIRPQITKYYAQGDMGNMFSLVLASTKYSLFLIMLISLPIMIETPYIIRLWLGQLPEYVVAFTRLVVAITMVDVVAMPLMTTAHATGKIALYQSLVGTLTILILPISYLLLCFKDSSPMSVFWVSLIMSFVCLFVRLWIVRRLVKFPVNLYLVEILKGIVVIVVSAIIPISTSLYLDSSFFSFLLVVILSIISSLFFIYLLGLSQDERMILFKYLKRLKRW